MQTSHRVQPGAHRAPQQVAGRCSPRLRAPLCTPRLIPQRQAGCSRSSGIVQSSKLQTVLSEIDALNSQDPRTATVDGKEVPYQLAHSRWLTDWVLKLTASGDPPASDELQIVARGQHVQRWTSPRTSYPEGRTGYLKWREDLKKFHAKTVTDIMAKAGYDEEACNKVNSIINKKNLRDPEHQIIEDALCLVFLERQFADFRKKETEEKMIDILRKTWKKMGPKGRDAALALPLPPEEAALVGKALSE